MIRCENMTAAEWEKLGWRTWRTASCDISKRRLSSVYGLGDSGLFRGDLELAC